MATTRTCVVRGTIFEVPVEYENLKYVGGGDPVAWYALQWTRKTKIDV